jgi:hypothetical protein
VTIRYNEDIVQFSVTQNVNTIFGVYASCRVLKIVTFVFISFKPKCEGKIADRYFHVPTHSLYKHLPQDVVKYENGFWRNRV